GFPSRLLPILSGSGRFSRFLLPALPRLLHRMPPASASPRVFRLKTPRHDKRRTLPGGKPATPRLPHAILSTTITQSHNSPRRRFPFANLWKLTQPKSAPSQLAPGTVVTTTSGGIAETETTDCPLGLAAHSTCL